MSTYEQYLSHETLHEEFIDGEVSVNPPNRRHVRIARRLALLLEDSLPEEMEVLLEFGWEPIPGTMVEPDLMVAFVDSPGDDALHAPPVLVVEITSPSTSKVDWGRKRELYSFTNLPYYWIIDEDKLTTFERQDGELVVSDELTTGRHTIELYGAFSVTIDLEEMLS